MSEFGKNPAKISLVQYVAIRPRAAQMILVNMKIDIGTL